MIYCSIIFLIYILIDDINAIIRENYNLQQFKNIN